MDYTSRLERIRQILLREGVDALCVGPGSNLYYLTGIRAMVSERLFLLIIHARRPAQIIIPLLERESVETIAGSLDIMTWTDEEGYLPQLRNIFENPRIVAIENQLWSGYSIDLMNCHPGVELMKGYQLLWPMRAVKSHSELQILEEAAAIADRAFEEILKEKFTGKSEREIMLKLEALLIKHGQERMQFGIVASGPNSSQPHHESSDRKIEPGDVVILDFGGTYKDYQSDMTRMVAVRGKELPEGFQKVYDTVDNARKSAHETARIGETAESVDRAARNVIEQAGYGKYFIHRTGHGIGLDIHEAPYIVGGNKTVLDEGMTFSIEPGIYLPGKFGVRIEDVAVVRPEGSLNINRSPHELQFVD